jgi:CBS domain-containing protein
MMFEKNVPCVVVTDEKGLPMSILTASDVRRFNENNLDSLLKTLGSFTCGYDGLETGPPFSVTGKDNAGEAFSRMQLYGIHQVLMVSDENKAFGILPMQLLINPVVLLEQERRGRVTGATQTQQQTYEYSQKSFTEEKKSVTVEAGGETEETQGQLPIPTNS